MARIHAAHPQTPLHRLLALEEREISHTLLEYGIVTPGSVVSEESGTAVSRLGFVQILVYNPHDGKLYAKFSSSPLAAAVKLLEERGGNRDEVWDLVDRVVKSHRSVFENMVRHCLKLVQRDKFLPFHFLYDPGKREALEWIESLVEALESEEALGVGTPDELFQFLPIDPDDVFQSLAYESEPDADAVGSEKKRPSNQSTEGDTRPSVGAETGKFSDLVQAHTERVKRQPERQEYWELAHTFDALWLAPWVSSEIDLFRKVCEEAAGGWRRLAKYLKSQKQMAYRHVKMPIWSPHSLTGALVVGWAGEEDLSGIEGRLALHAERLGAELRKLRAAMSAWRLQQGGSEYSAAIDLIGCRRVKLKGETRGLLEHPLWKREETDEPGSDSEDFFEMPTLCLPNGNMLDISYAPVTSCSDTKRIQLQQEKWAWEIGVAWGHQLFPGFSRRRARTLMEDLCAIDWDSEIEAGKFAAAVVMDLICRHLRKKGLERLDSRTQIRLRMRATDKGLNYYLTKLAERDEDSERVVGIWWKFSEPDPNQNRIRPFHTEGKNRSAGSLFTNACKDAPSLFLETLKEFGLYAAPNMMGQFRELFIRSIVDKQRKSEELHEEKMDVQGLLEGIISERLRAKG